MATRQINCKTPLLKNKKCDILTSSAQKKFKENVLQPIHPQTGFGIIQSKYLCKYYFYITITGFNHNFMHFNIFFMQLIFPLFCIEICIFILQTKRTERIVQDFFFFKHDFKYHCRSTVTLNAIKFTYYI